MGSNDVGRSGNVDLGKYQCRLCGGRFTTQADAVAHPCPHVEHPCRDCGKPMEAGRYGNGSRRCVACFKADYRRNPGIVLTPEMEADAHG